jgi:hypothetical protein
VDVLLRVQTSNDPFQPFVELVESEAHAGWHNIGSIPSSHIS